MNPNVREEILVKKDLSISTAKANFYSIYIAIPLLVFLITLYVSFWGKSKILKGIEMISQNQLRFFLIVIIGVVIHELLHGLSWAYFGQKPLRDIQFGFQVKTLTPYAHCKVPLDVRAYRLGTATPGILLGFFPVIIGFITGTTWSMIFGLLFILLAAGDILILWLIRKLKVGQLVEDHPTRVGCYVIKIEK